MSTENTYKYHMQVQENTTSSSVTQSSIQQTHSGPLKQLLKPRAHPGSSTSECSVSENMSNHHQNDDEESAINHAADEESTSNHAGDDQTQTSAIPVDSQLSNDVIGYVMSCTFCDTSPYSHGTGN